MDPLARNLSDSEMSEDALDHAFDSDSEGERKKPLIQKKQLNQQPSAKVRAGADSNVFQVCLQIKEGEQYTFKEPARCGSCKAVMAGSCMFCSIGSKESVDSQELFMVQDYETKEKQKSKSTVVCLDVSGSMNDRKTGVTEITKEYLQRRSNVAAKGDATCQPKQDSLLATALYSIEQNVSRMAADEPMTKFGLVSFGSSVQVLGDCSKPHFELGRFQMDNFY